MTWAEARKLVLDRDDYKCARCGAPAGDVHHRKPKGMGGTSDPEIAFGMANLVSLCRSCHDAVHHHPLAEGYPFGFLVHNFERPEDIPITRKGVTVWLRPDGTAERKQDVRF